MLAQLVQRIGQQQCGLQVVALLDGGSGQPLHESEVGHLPSATDRTLELLGIGSETSVEFEHGTSQQVVGAGRPDRAHPLHVFAQHALSGEPAHRLGEHLGSDRVRQSELFALRRHGVVDVEADVAGLFEALGGTEQMQWQRIDHHGLTQGEQLGELELGLGQLAEPIANEVVQPLAPRQLTGQHPDAVVLVERSRFHRRGDELAHVQRVALRHVPDRCVRSALDLPTQQRLDQGACPDPVERLQIDPHRPLSLGE